MNTKCLSCNASEVDLVSVVSDVRFGYQEKWNKATNTYDREEKYAVRAYICRVCGHIDLYVDNEDI